MENGNSQKVQRTVLEHLVYVRGKGIAWGGRGKRDKGENELRRGNPFAWKVNEPLQGERNAPRFCFRRSHSIRTRTHTCTHIHVHTHTLACLLLLPDIYLASAAFHDPHIQREIGLVVSLRLLTTKKPVLLLRVIVIFDIIRVHLNPFIEKNDSEIVTRINTRVALETYISLYQIISVVVFFCLLKFWQTDLSINIVSKNVLNNELGRLYA